MSKKYLIQIIPQDGNKIKNFNVTSLSLRLFVFFLVILVALLLAVIAFFTSFKYMYDTNIENKQVIKELNIKNSKIYDIEKNLYKMDLFQEKLKKFVNTSDIEHIDISAILNEEDSKNFNINDVDYDYLPNIIPLAGWITAKYNQKYHPGIDIAANENSPFIAAASGKVFYKGESDVFGRYVIIEHKKGLMTKYSHANDIIVDEGEMVKKGQLIGFIGRTGSTSGAHLHFEILKNGKNINPIKFINNFYQTKIEE